MKQLLRRPVSRWRLVIAGLAIVVFAASTLLQLGAASMLLPGLNSYNAGLGYGTPELRYIPRSVVRSWQEHDYLVVFGIPSSIVGGRRKRRYLQRESCWKYAGVATKRNGFSGTMLVLYVLGVPPTPAHADALREEALQWHDVVAVPVPENASAYATRRKTLEVEVAMSRKTFLWYQLALKLFPSTSYIVKADDDIFLRVPQYLADLRALPRRGLYWGRGLKMTQIAKGRFYRFMYACGYCSTTSRDVVERVVSYAPLRELALNEFQPSRRKEYMELFLNHEDVMVAFVLTLTEYPIVLVVDQLCRFHYVVGGFENRTATPESLVLHYVKLVDYMTYKTFFSTVDVQPTIFEKASYTPNFKGKTVLTPTCIGSNGTSAAAPFSATQL